jgi:predicted GTPase
MYRGADKSLARPGRKQATATEDFDFHITKLDKEKNHCIREKTGAQNIVNEIKQYQKKWLKQVQRMDTNRLPKQALQYRPKERRNLGRPRTRWRDQLHFEDQ